MTLTFSCLEDFFGEATAGQLFLKRTASSAGTSIAVYKSSYDGNDGQPLRRSLGNVRVLEQFSTTRIIISGLTIYTPNVLVDAYGNDNKEVQDHIPAIQQTLTGILGQANFTNLAKQAKMLDKSLSR